MTVDQSKEQINKYIASTDQTMATTSTFTPSANHFKTDSTSSSLENTSQESLELSKRLRGLDLKDKSKLPNSAQNIPRRQPTIVCEDIADDIELDEEDFPPEEGVGDGERVRTPGVTRSASTASLTVPLTPECDEEKRRPPLPGDDQMLIESN